MLVLVGLCLPTAVVHAGPREDLASLWAKSKTTNDRNLKPCSGDFELQLSVMPTQGVEAGDSSARIGVNLKYAAAAARGIASVPHTKEESKFTKARCERWQKKYWPLLSSIIAENKRPERASMICFNVGTVHYKVGRADRRANICLSDAKQDSLTFAFRYFYDGTDALVAR